MTIDDLIKFAADSNASDLHISGNEQPIIRVAGTLKKLDIPPLKEDEIKKMILDTLSASQIKFFEKEWDIDYSYELEGIARCRANAFIGTRGYCAAFRIVSAKVLEWDSLGLPANIKELADKEKGLVLITGPAGCGKSTTMTSFIDVINKNRSAHILTVEDPVEFLHTSSKSLITHRQVGKDTESFAAALKGALREDPDVILVGEMRDRETIQLALTAAETGHLVVSTLHTNSAPKTINRIINAFSASDQGQIRTMLAEGLLAVVSQVLVPRKDGKSVVPAFEILYVTSTVRSMIRADKLYEIPSVIETGMKYNMRTLQQSLSKLIIDGVCWREDCEKFSENPYGLPQNFMGESKNKDEKRTSPVITQAIPSPVGKTAAPTEVNEVSSITEQAPVVSNIPDSNAQFFNPEYLEQSAQNTDQ